MTPPFDMSPSIRESYRRAEEAARNRLPHLYRVARLFPDPERYHAFCATYASMRWVDDRVDSGRATIAELDRYAADLETAFNGRPGPGPWGAALADTFARFDFVLEPWERLVRSMRQDVDGAGFAHYGSFLEYAEGATVAPAAVFATLLLMRPSGSKFRPALPYATIRDSVRAAAIACYETHILRDAQADLAAGLNYFPLAELKAYRLDPSSGLDEAWRPYLRAYGMRVRGGWEPALAELEDIESPMTDRERLMLHALVEIYGFSLKKIHRLNYDVWSDRHWPEASEIQALLADLAGRLEPGLNISELAVRMIEDV